MQQFKLENDLGQAPIALAHFSSDESHVGVLTILSGLVLGSFLGPFGLVLAAFAAYNDVTYVKNKNDGLLLGSAPVLLESSAVELEAVVEPEVPRQQRQPIDFPELPDVPLVRRPADPWDDDLFELALTESPAPTPAVAPDFAPASRMTQPQANQRSVQMPLAPKLWEDESTALPTDRASLLDALKRDCPEFVRLLKAPPIRCVGMQRTGKTTLVKLLCLCRQIILKGHQVIASTPHYKEGEGYPACFKIAGIRGTARDPVAIAREWNAMAQRVTNCGTPGRSFTNIWDEFGLYDSCVEPESLLSVVTSTIRETTKFGEYPIFIVHGETAVFLPGVKGLIGPFLQGTTRIETLGAPAYDDEGIPTVRPTGRFRITWTDGGNSSGQIPEWLTEDLLVSLLAAEQTPIATTEKPALLLNQSLTPASIK